MKRTRGRPAVVLVLMLALLMGCNQGSSTDPAVASTGQTTANSAADVPTLVTMDDAEGWMEAILTGTVVIEGQCVYFEAGAERGLAVFPSGAKIDGTTGGIAVAFPDGGVIPVGVETQVVGGESSSAVFEGPGVLDGVEPGCVTSKVFFAAPIEQ
jgi:hypothetical protein